MALQLKLDPTGVEAGAAKAKAALDGVKASAVKAESAIDSMARTGTQSVAPVAPAVDKARVSIDAVGKSGFAAGGGMRMLGQQLSQVAQQGSVTGNYLGALAVQLPDIALGFGSVAIAASLVATVALPLLVTAFGDGKSAIDRLADAMDEAATSVDDATAAQDAASKSIAELSEKYGGAAVAVKTYLDTIAQAASLTAMDDIQKQIQAIADTVGLLYTTNKGNPMGWATGAALDLGLTRDTAKDLQSSIEAVGRAKGYDAQVAAAAALNDKLFQIYGSVAAMPDEMRALAAQTAIAGTQAADLANNAAQIPGFFQDAYDAIVNMVAAAPGGGWLSGAMGDADGLAAKLWNAFSAANATRLALLQSNLSAPGADGRVVDLAALNAGGRGRGLPANVGDMDFSDAPLGTGGVRPPPRPDDIDFGFTPPGAGGGGAGAADRTREAYDRLMASLDPVVAKTQDMAEATKTADAALAAHDITAAEHANALDLIAQKYGQTSNAMADLQEVGGNAIDSLIGGTMSLSDALRQMAKDLVFATIKAQLLKSVTGATEGDSIGGLLMKGILGGIGGGGGGGNVLDVSSLAMMDAGGSIPRGGVAMVGERGPELVRATSGGAVVTSRVDTARMMQGGGQIDVVVHGGDLVLNDNGSISTRIRVSAQMASSQAVQTVRRNFGQMQNDFARDGALV